MFSLLLQDVVCCFALSEGNLNFSETMHNEIGYKKVHLREENRSGSGKKSFPDESCRIVLFVQKHVCQEQHKTARGLAEEMFSIFLLQNCAEEM